MLLKLLIRQTYTPEDILFDADRLTEYRELNAFINNGIEKLPPQQQRAFRLSRDGGLTHEQIAHEMNVTRETVKGCIVRAISFLRQYLKKHGVALIAFCANNHL